ncbi:Hsp20 family protein [Ferrovibrio terrae]|jgi:HSP20 family molecular chaperone IbpA|uniref:Hsp20 family protein n=1 Tax=Ferrovibrio terrae TaxID=2594003 RepID=UPI00313783C5
MTRVSIFSSPLLLGFDHVERMIERATKAGSEGYPPYNIEQTGENDLRITLALAGFSATDLGITVEDNQLVIRGKQSDDKERIYLHRGIAARQFQRSFVLADGIEVVRAELRNGLLHIDLHRPRPESQIRNIAINTTDGGRSDTLGVTGKTGGSR